jgi:RimJ/RimL family protein N-acetyltransferase
METLLNNLSLIIWKMSENSNTRVFAIEVEGKHIGTIGLHDMNRKDSNTSLGILIGVVLGLALSYNVIDFLKRNSQKTGT